MTMPALKRNVSGTYDEVLARVPELLATEGFGVLTEIDVKATLEKKIDVDFRPYTILGACNPPLAHRALSHDLDVGVLLPCNVLVYQDDDGGVVVSAMDPEAAIGAFGGDELKALAREVRDRLSRVLDKLG
jgi:uncharacterized protein (DUF302 family)